MQLGFRLIFDVPTFCLIFPLFATMQHPRLYSTGLSLLVVAILLHPSLALRGGDGDPNFWRQEELGDLEVRITGVSDELVDLHRKVDRAHGVVDTGIGPGRGMVWIGDGVDDGEESFLQDSIMVRVS